MGQFSVHVHQIYRQTVGDINTTIMVALITGNNELPSLKYQNETYENVEKTKKLIKTVKPTSTVVVVVVVVNFIKHQNRAITG